MGRIILFLLISAFSFAQMNTITIQGDDYQFVGNHMMEYRTSTTEYSIDESDPSSYIDDFIRDAILNEQDLDLVPTNNRYANIVYGYALTLRLNTVTLVPSRWYLGKTIQGSSWVPNGGYIITINQDRWNIIDSDEKFRLMYHELGHALLNFGHVCQYTVYWDRNEYGHGQSFTDGGIMSTGECHPSAEGPGSVRAGLRCNSDALNCSNTYLYGRPWGYNFRVRADILEHFYTETTPLYTIVSRSGKGSGVIHD